MAEIIRDLPDHAKPICPNDDGENPLHRLRVRVLDRFSEAAPKNAEHEFVAEGVEAAYSAAAYGGDHLMDLFHHSASVWQLGRTTIVESWWWRCPVCGFTLPAIQARP